MWRVPILGGPKRDKFEHARSLEYRSNGKISIVQDIKLVQRMVEFCVFIGDKRARSNFRWSKIINFGTNVCLSTGFFKRISCRL